MEVNILIWGNTATENAYFMRIPIPSFHPSANHMESAPTAPENSSTGLFEKSLKDDLAALAKEITADIIPPKENKEVLGSTILLGDAARLAGQAQKLPWPTIEQGLLNTLQGKSFFEQGGEQQIIAKWESLVFYMHQEDIHSNPALEKKAQQFVIQALNDIARTDGWTFLLNRIRADFTGKKWVYIQMGSGIMEWGKSLNAEEHHHDEIASWHLEEAHLHPAEGEAEKWENKWDSISWPFDYAYYHISEDWNTKGQTSIATSPSEILFHEFWHLYDDPKLVQAYLNQAQEKGIFIDVDHNGIHDAQELKSVLTKAGHTWLAMFDIAYKQSTATYREQLMAYQKKEQWFSDHLARPYYVKDGKPSGKTSDWVPRVGIPVDNAAYVRPSKMVK